MKGGAAGKGAPSLFRGGKLTLSKNGLVSNEQLAGLIPAVEINLSRGAILKALVRPKVVVLVEVAG